jgi:hypothetical protein
MTYTKGNKTALELSLGNSNVISQIALNRYILFVVFKLPIFCNASGMPNESCDDLWKVHLLL